MLGHCDCGQSMHMFTEGRMDLGDLLLAGILSNHGSQSIIELLIRNVKDPRH